jgi:Aminoglycoside/hydroxyurea antibiotic resistance kinase
VLRYEVLTVVLRQPVRWGVRVPDMPAEMRRRILDSWGNEAHGWLEAIPLIAARRARAWQLELDATIVNGFDSWVLTCSDGLGRRRIVKLIPDPRSARAQAETLVAWRRFGASRCVELVAFDRKDSAILLERVEPGDDGTTLRDPSRATHEAAAILTDLHRRAPKDIALPSLADKVAGDLVYIRERLEPCAARKAEELVADLIRSPSSESVILHADFSLRNMKEDLAALFEEIFCYLATGLAAADNQHLAGGQRARIGIFVCVDDVERRLKPIDARRAMRSLVRTRGDDDVWRADVTR